MARRFFPRVCAFVLACGMLSTPGALAAPITRDTNLQYFNYNGRTLALVGTSAGVRKARSRRRSDGFRREGVCPVGLVRPRYACSPGYRAFEAEVKVVTTLPPSVSRIVIATTETSARISPYSTIVWPSSECRRARTRSARSFIGVSPSVRLPENRAVRFR